MNFLNLRFLKIFLDDSSFFIISAFISWNWWLLLLVLVFNNDSVVIICVIMVIVLSQNCTKSSIKDKELCFSFEYQLSRYSWLWFLIVGSSISSNPLGISFSLMHCYKSPWDSNRFCDKIGSVWLLNKLFVSLLVRQWIIF